MTERLNPQKLLNTAEYEISEFFADRIAQISSRLSPYHIIRGDHLFSGEIPVIGVVGQTIPQAWERAVIAAWRYGTQIPTQYDQSHDPPSKDTTMVMVITNPSLEPRIHRCFPGGLDELYVYTQEVIAGVHNTWVGELTGWSYSYHDRMRNWPGKGGWKKVEDEAETKISLSIDQINTMINQLAAAPYTRRAQASTWNPSIDPENHEPPCLQRIWCRMPKCPTPKGEFYFLEMNTHWRSRDAFKAAFMNLYAIAELQLLLTKQLTKELGETVLPGRISDVADSWHIYGSYIAKGEIDNFFHRIRTSRFSTRVWDSTDSTVKQQFALGQARLDEEHRHLPTPA